MAEIDLMDRYPRTKRPIAERKNNVSDADRALSRQFGKDYFDGDRMHGYGGYYYHPRFWQGTVRRFQEHYRLPANASILDVGCAKGFMLHDFKELIPEIKISGIDVSQYALDHAMETVKPHLQIGNVKALPFADESLDLVIAINVIHNLELEECKKAIREIQRVSRGKSFIVVDAYRNEGEKQRLINWVVTCRTHMYVHEWKKVFAETGYTGDYWWFFAE
jgi:ubiquinone/menaquinone biosynthesis C-methylase UbiE